MFGLHVALAQINEHSAVAFQHPQWMTPGLVKDYFGSTGICLNNPDAKAWLQEQVAHSVVALKPKPSTPACAGHIYHRRQRRGLHRDRQRRLSQDVFAGEPPASPAPSARSLPNAPSQSDDFNYASAVLGLDSLMAEVKCSAERIAGKTLY